MARSSDLFILTLPLYWQVFGGAGLRVTQTPGTLSVTEGGNANITCSWDTEYEDERIRVWWKLYYESPRAAPNGTVLANVMWANNKSEVRVTSRDQSDYRLMKDKAELWLFSVNKSDAGTYICEVTIDKPELRFGKGTGTILYVTDSPSSTESTTDFPKVAYLAVFVIIAAVISLGYFLYKRKKKANILPLHQRAPEAVELNEMQENMNDREESSSSDSVQWAISTLYESCNYFAMGTPQNPEDYVYSLAK
ncbi:hypothetical protein XENTR_v10000337 [Xenopus tropicalis]|uniref:Uncharacterized protein LOC100489121 n=1 Tax=Xenopus tropicalis TaxID=8364 RepID=A0A8J1IZZ8_XENTR|nr:uncharacterized protein LOC100489121 [Xenopus tropicalis]KAE8629044.1 hypothetical protein XENTR_v10000337 [Xenopus tropicalis]